MRELIAALERAHLVEAVEDCDRDAFLVEEMTLQQLDRHRLVVRIV